MKADGFFVVVVVKGLPIKGRMGVRDTNVMTKASGRGHSIGDGRRPGARGQAVEGQRFVGQRWAA